MFSRYEANHNSLLQVHVVTHRCWQNSWWVADDGNSEQFLKQLCSTHRFCSCAWSGLSVMGASILHLDLCETHTIPLCLPEAGISLGTYFSLDKFVKIHRKSLGRYFMQGYEWEKVLSCLDKLKYLPSPTVPSTWRTVFSHIL